MKPRAAHSGPCAYFRPSAQGKLLQGPSQVCAGPRRTAGPGQASSSPPAFSPLPASVSFCAEQVSALEGLRRTSRIPRCRPAVWSWPYTFLPEVP